MRIRSFILALVVASLYLSFGLTLHAGPFPNPPVAISVSAANITQGGSETFIGVAHDTYGALQTMNFYVTSNTAGLPGWNYIGSKSVIGTDASASISYTPTVAANDWGVHIIVFDTAGTVSNQDIATYFTVTAPVVGPYTTSITSDSPGVQAGSSTGIHADFAAGANDTLLNTNIDMPVGTTVPSTGFAHRDATYTFSSPGTYTFTARILTQHATNNLWASGNTVTVTAVGVPSASISTNKYVIRPGESANINATLNPGSFNTIAASEIDSPLGTSVTSGTSYNFTPAVADGIHTFYARMTPTYAYTNSNWPGATTTSTQVQVIPNVAPSGRIDTTNNTVLLRGTDNITIVGWASDPDYTITSTSPSVYTTSPGPVGQVNLYLSGTNLGAVTYGSTRSDVAAAGGYLNSGYSLSVPSASFAPGVYSITGTTTDVLGSTGSMLASLNSNLPNITITLADGAVAAVENLPADILPGETLSFVARGTDSGGQLNSMRVVVDGVTVQSQSFAPNSNTAWTINYSVPSTHLGATLPIQVYVTSTYSNVANGNKFDSTTTATTEVLELVKLNCDTQAANTTTVQLNRLSGTSTPRQSVLGGNTTLGDVLTLSAGSYRIVTLPQVGYQNVSDQTLAIP